jgi:hypothetical protein
MKLFLCLLLLTTGVASAQDSLDVRFLTTQTTAGNPYNLPISINSLGEFSFFGQGGTNLLSFSPALQTGLNRAIIQYSRPVVLNRFNFYPIQKELGWIEVKRLRVELGVGLTALIKSTFSLGIVPYKGAMQTIIRYKNTKEEKSLAFTMPKKLSELEKWNLEDSGLFQTYGGVSFFAGINLSVAEIASATIGIQNQFIVEMKKTTAETVKLLITEESLKRRQISIGPSLARADFASFKGKRFSVEFNLNLKNLEHHELFQKALAGEINFVQSRLPSRNQKLTWSGKDSHFYHGIPTVIGKIKDKGHYDLNEDGQETKLDFTGSRTKGFLSPLRNLQDFVYQTDDGMVVIWSSEMNKTNEDVVDQRFISRGRIIGVKGFNRRIPDNTKFGSVVSQIGIHFSKKEMSILEEYQLQEFEEHFRSRCEMEKLSCRKEKNLKKVMVKFKELIQKPWDKMRGEMGLLFVKEPAVIHSLIKTLRLKKEVYFKFLSEKFQSLEGSSPVEIE